MPKDRKSLRLEILEQVAKLATAGFGLVAALAWNDAIQALFMWLLPAASEVWAKFVYALLITAIVVFITIRIGGIIEKAKNI